MARITRRNNPTGLIEIDRKDVTISLMQDGSAALFSLTKLGIEPGKVPGDSRVICVARAGHSALRFDLGRFDSWDRSPKPLEGIDPSGLLHFRVLISSPSDAKLLASAENIRLRDPAQSESLIPIQQQDLGQLAWRLEIEASQGPTLLVNSTVYPNPAVAENDAQFVALVLPEALRQVCRAITDEPEGLDDESDWRSGWKPWLLGAGAAVPPPTEENEAAQEDWISDVVDRFCNKNFFCSRLLAQREPQRGA